MLGVVVTVGGDAREENPTKASLKSLDLVLRGLRRGCSWDPKPIICCLWLPFPYPERGGKVAFPPACLSPSGRQSRGQGWALPCCRAGSLLPGAWSCRQHSQA